MNILELQAKVLQMKLSGLTKIQITERLEISDEVLDNILHSIGDNRGSVKKYIRKQVMNMSLSELDKLKINDVNLSSVIARLEHLYCGFDNIPTSNVAYQNVLKYNNSGVIRKPLPHKEWNIKKAQHLLDKGVGKQIICKEIGINTTFLDRKIHDGVLNGDRWNAYKQDKAGNFALFIAEEIVSIGSIFDISMDTNISRKLLRSSVNEFFKIPNVSEMLFLKRLSYYEYKKLEEA